jgi:hypothetical protein
MWTAEIWSGVWWERQLGDVDSRNMERWLLGETAGRCGQQKYGAVFVGRDSCVMWTAEIWSGVFRVRQLGDLDSRNMERCLLGETAV